MEELKICSKCKRELPLDNFRWKNKSLGKKHSQCKECQKKQEHEHYKNSSTRRQNVLQTAQNQKERNSLLVEEYKKKGCQKCGEKRLYVLDCHHKLENEKFDDISKMIKSSGVEQLNRELQKCVVLCSNCHREFHFLERAENLTLDEYLGN